MQKDINTIYFDDKDRSYLICINGDKEFFNEEGDTIYFEDSTGAKYKISDNSKIYIDNNGDTLVDETLLNTTSPEGGSPVKEESKMPAGAMPNSNNNNAASATFGLFQEMMGSMMNKVHPPASFNKAVDTFFEEGHNSIAGREVDKSKIIGSFFGAFNEAITRFNEDSSDDEVDMSGESSRSSEED